MNTNDVIELLWQRKGRGTQKELAATLGVSNSFLCDVFQGKRGIGDIIPKALGLTRLPDRYEFAEKPKRKSK